MNSKLYQNGYALWIRNIAYEIAPIAITILCVYLLSYLYFGSFYARHHDNLNSEFVYNVVIGRFISSGFDTSEFDVFLGGSTRWYHYARALSPLTFIYALLDPKIAYFLTEVITRIIAYFSVLYLGSLYTIDRKHLIALALSYSLLLSFTVFGIGIHAAPLIFYFLLREKNITYGSVLIIIFIGLNSSLALHALFLPIAILISIPLIDTSFLIKRFILVMIIYLFSAFFGSFGLIYAQFFGEVSHRSVWVFDQIDLITWSDLFNTIINGLVTNQQWYHAVYVTHFKLSLGILACIIMLISFDKQNFKRAIYFLLIGSLISILDIYGQIIINFFPDIFHSIQIFRIGFFIPMITLFLVLAVLSSSKTILKKAMIFCTCAVFLSGAGAASGFKLSQFANSEDKKHLKSLFLSGQFNELIKSENINKLSIDISRHESFESFFDQHDIACIKDNLPLDEGQRVASFGIDPMISVYYGLPVIDGLHNFYPLWYKNAFIPIIITKMENSEAMRGRITTWGSRLHLFADKYAPHILPDFQRSYELGARYIISDRNITSPDLLKIEIGCEEKGSIVYRIIGIDY